VRGLTRRFCALLSLATLVAVGVFLSAPAMAAPLVVSSTELIQKAKVLDGQVVVYTGEAIGELLARGDYSWVNASDGANAIGLYMPTALANKISNFGTYKTRGDTIEVTGVFHRACPEHGGDLDIHVTDVKVLAQGGPISHRVHPARVVWAIVLSVLAGTLYLADRSRERKHRDNDGDLPPELGRAGL